MKIKRLITFSVFTLILLFITAISASAKEIFISTTGSDSANGLTESTSVASFSRAYSLLGTSGGDITVVDSATYTAAPSHSGTVTVKGKNASVTLSLPSEIILAGNTTFKTITLSGSSSIYASGKTLLIDADVKSDSRLNVYGGKKNASLTGNTNITLLGGQYNTVYGGGYSGAVNGNTNVVFGGNANPSDTPTDSGSPCKVYGGSYGAAVSGSTNVYLRGNAVAQYVVGTGGKAKTTNIYIEGGKAMNVYGGSIGNALDAGTVTNITMTGGSVEAIFGACHGVSMTGHTNITLLGGTVTRRVYSGCYNNADNKLIYMQYTTDYYVTGSTFLAIGPNVKLATGSDLNRGVFSGSRTKSQHDAEQNTLVFLDGCYSSQSSKIGEKGALYTSYFKSFQDYTVKAGTGGKVAGANAAGMVHIIPDEGYVGKIGTKGYKNETVSISTTTDISFVAPYTKDSSDKLSFNIDGVAIDLKNHEKETDTKLLLGWKKADGSYIDLSATTKINAYAGETYTPVYVDITKGTSDSDVYTNGAQVRSTLSGNKTVNDLRFVSQFKKSFLASELIGISDFGGENVKYGHVVIPVDERYLSDGELIEINKATSKGAMPKTAAAVKTYNTDGDFVQFTVCITKISKANYERCYAVRPYVIYTDKNGREKILYGKQYETASLKSVIESK